MLDQVYYVKTLKGKCLQNMGLINIYLYIYYVYTYIYIYICIHTFKQNKSICIQMYSTISKVRALGFW